ncbi:MAG TPA: MaoC/PaaZ C-terminal domain-containing protein, partial [Sphingomonas sp.]
MTEDPFVAAVPHRSFEDLQLGEFRRSREKQVTEEEILAFARAYDPQWFHADAELARQSVFGNVVASGIHVLAMWRQLDHEINSDIDFVCGIGWDELRLKKAVRPGDTIHVTSEIVALTPSTTRQDRGTALTR